jgi:phosphate ABC transporter phosphate-binding protein
VSLLALCLHAESPEKVRAIYVASLQEGARADALRERLIEQLSKSGSVRVVGDAAKADATLHCTFAIWSTGTISTNPRSNSTRAAIYQGYLSADLVGKDKQTLWSNLVTPSSFRTSGITEDLADHLAARLLDAVRTGAVSGSAPAAKPSEAHLALRAAGATLPAPLYRKWIESSGMQITYDAIGSEAGIEQLLSGKLDFAGSDMPLANDAHVLHFPAVVGGVVPIYNLAGLDRTLYLTPEVLAGIYSGEIRTWNDPRIRAANHGARLPDAAITVVHRADGSGTSFVWTSYLSVISPAWKSSVGAGTHVTWPVGIEAVGNDGVAALVAKTPNAIGYVELIYAIQHEVNYAAVKNAAGQFVRADLASITAAAESTAGTETSHDLRISILNAPGKNAYPVSTFTWLLVPEDIQDPQKLSSIAAFLRWMLTSGQKECSSLGYAPLPKGIVARELQAIERLK